MNSQTGSSMCANCGGLIMEPGVAYGYAGRICYCQRPPQVQRPIAEYFLEPREYKRALRDAHDKIDALQAEVARLKAELLAVKEQALVQVDSNVLTSNALKRANSQNARLREVLVDMSRWIGPDGWAAARKRATEALKASDAETPKSGGKK